MDFFSPIIYNCDIIFLKKIKKEIKGFVFSILPVMCKFLFIIFYYCPKTVALSFYGKKFSFIKKIQIY